MKEWILYYAQWLLPSTTALFWVLTVQFFWHPWVAYVVASLVSGTVYIPINKYIFKK